jgi:hypothetical protein
MGESMGESSESIFSTGGRNLREGGENEIKRGRKHEAYFLIFDDLIVVHISFSRGFLDFLFLRILGILGIPMGSKTPNFAENPNTLLQPPELWCGHILKQRDHTTLSR